jgi:DNA (cytosine-5)-methyltransferase 1
MKQLGYFGLKKSTSDSSIRQKNTLKKRKTALSLFSGAGGMDLGIVGAEFDVVASIEIDPYCCQTLRKAASTEKRKTWIIEEDIRKIDPVKLREDLGIKTGELDLLCGGPPCQAFSQIGKRKCLDDPRGMLLFEMTRFAEVFRPKAILIEQVKGLINAGDKNGKKGGVLELLLSELEALGYVSKWQVINAADYGVAQLRERVFVVSILQEKNFEFPPPIYCSQQELLPLFPLASYKTVREAIEGLGKPQSKSDSGLNNNHIDVTPEGDRSRIKGVPEGCCLAKQLHLPKEQRGNLTKKDTTKFRRLSYEEPALTLRCGEIFFHPTEDRYLTPREYMRIHGYPDDYLLLGPVRGRSGRVRFLDQHRQVANSVPPPVAAIIAKAIKRTLECQKSLKYLVSP